MGHVRSWGRTPLGWKAVSTGGSGMAPPPPESCLLSCFISRLSLTLAWIPMCLNCFSFSHPLTSPLLWTFGPIFFYQGNLPPTHILLTDSYPPLRSQVRHGSAQQDSFSMRWAPPPSPSHPFLALLCWLLACLLPPSAWKSGSCVSSRGPSTCLGAWAQEGSVFGGWLWKHPGGRGTTFQVSHVSTCFSFPLGLRS